MEEKKTYKIHKTIYKSPAKGKTTLDLGESDYVDKVLTGLVKMYKVQNNYQEIFTAKMGIILFNDENGDLIEFGSTLKE